MKVITNMLRNVEGDSNGTLDDYYREAISNARSEIDSREDEYMIKVNVDELTKYYSDMYRLSTLQVDTNRKNIRYKDAIQIVPPQTITPESKVPVFVKNNAAFWADGKITDSDFVQGIQYLIENKIMIVLESTISGTTTPSVTVTTPTVSGTTSPIISGTTTPTIPAWVKNNAKWWSEDQITEGDFLQGIQWMIGHGVITLVVK